MTLLVGKIFFSVVVVLCLSWIVEHVGPRVAGILAGMPLGGVLVLFFVGLDQGDGFASLTAAYATASVLATLGFAYGYVLPDSTGRVSHPLLSTMSGLTAYFLIAGVLDWVQPNSDFAAFLAIVLLAIAARFPLTRQGKQLDERVSMTFPRLFFRAALAALIIVLITGFSNVIGPEWSGLLIGFPITFLPFVLIVHMTYSIEPVLTIVRNLPLGLISLVIFLLIATRAILEYGTNVGILVSLVSALAYLTGLAVLVRRIRGS